MTELPERAERAFECHDAFERADDEWFAVTTTAFDGRVTAAETDEWALEYTLEVRAPMLSTATEGSVGDAVEEGWFDTYERRLEDAHMVVREDVEFDTYRVFEEAGDAVSVFVFEHGNPDRAVDIAKAIAEFVEGTYMEGIVPGYQYRPPVSELLARARQAGDESERDRGPMPL